MHKYPVWFDFGDNSINYNYCLPFAYDENFCFLIRDSILLVFTAKYLYFAFIKKIMGALASSHVQNKTLYRTDKVFTGCIMMPN